MDIDIPSLTIKEVAEYVGKLLSNEGIDVILVGGAVVSIYTNNNYVSYDLDLITYTPLKKVKAILEKVGFSYTKEHYFTYPNCDYFLEFVSPPVAIGNEPVSTFNETQSAVGAIKCLTPTDCVKDRLAAYFHWDDTQSLEQAVLVARDQKINITSIKKWAEKEQHLDKFQVFSLRLSKEYNLPET